MPDFPRTRRDRREGASSAYANEVREIARRALAEPRNEGEGDDIALSDQEPKEQTPEEVRANIDWASDQEPKG